MKQTKAIRNLVLVSTLALGVAGCENEVILEGMREELRSPDYDLTDPGATATARAAAAEAVAPDENRSLPASLGTMSNVGSWTHRGGNTAHLVPHAALSAQPQLVWQASAGTGNERKYRITAEPVAVDGRIFVMDSHANVTALTTSGGAEIWSLDTTAPGERSGSGSGGGLALGDGKLFVTTTHGELVAVNPASGAVLWRQAFDAALNGAPTVANGHVYVTTALSEAFAIRTDNGKIAWRLSGTPSQHGVSGVAAPAVAGRTVLFPLANGSLLGVDAGDGTAKWAARVTGDRPNRGHTVLQAFTGEPVVSGGTVYIATPAGRTAAVSLDGALRWSAHEGALGMMAVAGGSLYFVNDEQNLVRLSSASGDKIWSVDLPRYDKDKPRRLKSIYPAFGPVMAGGRLWIASGDGFLRAFNPADGAPLAVVELPAGAASRPITVGGLLFVMTEKGDLLALR